MKWRHGVIVASAILVVVVGASILSAREAAVVQQSSRILCRDDKGAEYSRGAMVRVHNQIQRCGETGGWELGPDEAPLDPKVVGTAVCRSAAKDDKGQEYAPGLVHAVAGSFERCVRGKWRPEK